LTPPPQCAFNGLMQNMRSADGFLSIALSLMSSFRVSVTAMMCSGRSFSSSAPFHSKIVETGHTNDTFEKAIYDRCDAMRELRRLLRAPRLSILSPVNLGRMLWACQS